MGEIRRARSLADNSGDALRLATTETRFLLKSEQMPAARRLADSLLRADSTPTLDDAEQLRGLAALTGRLHAAARLLRRAAPAYTFMTSTWEPVEVPLPIADAALELLAYASFGAPRESLTVVERRVERLIPSYLEPNAGCPTREAMLDWPAALAYPEQGLGPTHRPKAGGNYLMEMQWALARGDTTGVRRQFSVLREIRGEQRPGDVSFEGTYHEARILLALGDTSTATHLLDLSLDALPPWALICWISCPR